MLISQPTALQCVPELCLPNTHLFSVTHSIAFSCGGIADSQPFSTTLRNHQQKAQEFEKHGTN